MGPQYQNGGPRHSGRVEPTSGGGFLQRVSGWFGSQKADLVKHKVATTSSKSVRCYVYMY